MKKILQTVLKIFAKIVLAKYNPDVVGITGSIGKTSTREAIYTVLSSRFNVRVNIENYNNEIGLPLTIMGFKSAKGSFWGWCSIFYKIIKLIIFHDHNFPKIIILEMAVDRPGDMDYLNTIVSPKIAVITRIGTSHLEFFTSKENIFAEKIKVLDNLTSDGCALINYDDKLLASFKDNSQKRIMTFGLDSKADFTISNLQFNFEQSQNIDSLTGISFELKHKDSSVPVLLPKAISYASVYASLAAAGVGFCFGINAREISNALLNFNPIPGRMNLIKGIEDSVIIDDSYNSSPQSLTAALNIIAKINLQQNKTKWIVLGDMLELGKESKKEHFQIGTQIAKIVKARLLTYGALSQEIAQGAIKAGMKNDEVVSFDSQAELIKFLKTKIKPDDLILIKGSRGMKMEKVVYEFMDNKKQAENILVH